MPSAAPSLSFGISSLTSVVAELNSKANENPCTTRSANNRSPMLSTRSIK
jgi:hypothetical protein